MGNHTRISSRLGLLVAALLGLLLVAELSSWLVLRALLWRSLAQPDARQELAIYSGQPWASQYWRENARVVRSLQYRPYVMSRREAFEGEHINVDAEGIRVTHGISCEPGVPVVLMLGGSTLWGYGVPDGLTIPSLVAGRFRESGRPLCVVNYGELGRTSTTELVELSIAASSRRWQPAAVVSYDGCNDVLVAWSEARSRPGTSAWFGEAMTVAAEAHDGSFGYLRYANAGTLLGRLSDRFWPGSPPEGSPSPASIAARVAERYLANVDLVASVARSIGAEPLSFLQPVALVGKKPLDSEENGRLAGTIGSDLERLRDLYEQSYERVRQGQPASLHDLSPLFDRESEPLYFDVCHVGPRANEIVAAAIAGPLAKALDPGADRRSAPVAGTSGAPTADLTASSGGP